jgi:hypothetical protein
MVMNPSHQYLAAALLILAFVFAPGPAIGQTCAVTPDGTDGDCSRVKVNSGAKSRIVVVSSVIESGVVAGATVRAGAFLQLDGRSTGTIDVDSAALLVLNGICQSGIRVRKSMAEINGVAGNIYLKGGRAIVRGTIQSVSGTGSARFEAGSVVGGVVQRQVTDSELKNPSSPN